MVRAIDVHVHQPEAMDRLVIIRRARQEGLDLGPCLIELSLVAQALNRWRALAFGRACDKSERRDGKHGANHDSHLWSLVGGAGGPIRRSIMRPGAGPELIGWTTQTPVGIEGARSL